MKEYKFKINGADYNVNINEVEGQEIKLDVNGTSYTVTVNKEMRAQKPRTHVVKTQAAPRVAAATSGNVQRASGPTNSVKVTTPLPGTILDVYVNVGDQVKAGQRVALLEAMKMENNIEADTDGTVTAVEVRKGDAVLEGQTLVVIG